MGAVGMPGLRWAAHAPWLAWSDQEGLAIVGIRYRHWLFRLPLARNYAAMVVGRRILFKDGPEAVSARLLRHETIHQEQMDRHGVAGFYARYLTDYLRGLWRLRNHDAAYRAIAFEQEAYAREAEPTAAPAGSPPTPALPDKAEDSQCGSANA